MNSIVECLPDELILNIIYFMDTKTFAKFRLIYKTSWKLEKVKQYAKCNLIDIENNHINFPRYGNTLSFQYKDIANCVHCKHKPISFIEWENGNKRRYIPWCILHVPATVMDGVECYCIGGN